MKLKRYLTTILFASSVFASSAAAAPLQFEHVATSDVQSDAYLNSVKFDGRYLGQTTALSLAENSDLHFSLDPETGDLQLSIVFSAISNPDALPGSNGSVTLTYSALGANVSTVGGQHVVSVGGGTHEASLDIAGGDSVALAPFAAAPSGGTVPGLFEGPPVYLTLLPVLGSEDIFRLWGNFTVASADFGEFLLELNLDTFVTSASVVNPEPASVLLLGGGLVWLRRRRPTN